MVSIERRLKNINRQIDSFGAEIQYKRYLSTVYSDPVRRINPIKTYATPVTMTVKLDTEKHRSDENFIQGDMEILLVGDCGFVPSIEDRIFYDSKTYTLTTIVPHKIGTDVLYYRIRGCASK